MQFASVLMGSEEVAVLVDQARGVVPIRDISPGTTGDLLAVIRSGELDRIIAAADAAPDSRFASVESVTFVAPYRHPRMLWGIGLNYVAHAADLAEAVPEEPASFIKGDHTVIGPGEDIPIPVQSVRTTAEAELAVVIGRYCRDVEPEDALSYLLGVCPVLDQTAEDILELNPRFLTRAKNFPGFFSFGPRIVPLDEATAAAGSLADLTVSTVVNGTDFRTNTISNMRFDPAYLISFHSKVMPLYPGDIISTGTPGAIHIKAGDVAECRIDGVGVLTNPVVAPNQSH
jgi:2-keto-4-pentenoate hydratase/2-oxohepta-3-ene-1,7-dioic acid hydratase in catechol pathway